MKTLIVLAVLIAPFSLFSQQPGDTVTIHVSASHYVTHPLDRGSVSYEEVTATVKGRKIDLESGLSGPDLLLPGDYRARLISETQTAAIMERGDRFRAQTVSD